MQDILYFFDILDIYICHQLINCINYSNYETNPLWRKVRHNGGTYMRYQLIHDNKLRANILEIAVLLQCFNMVLLSMLQCSSHVMCRKGDKWRK